ncbi:MAG: phosphatidate cytidylyltransferase [Solobacterium sp.]|nr:phosphatidate cytidylyltransferase [Solobacterium sp.]
MSKKMLIKIVTGVVIIACVLPPILLGGIPMECLIGFVAACSAYEISSLSDQKPHYIRAVLLFAVIEIMGHMNDLQVPFAASLFMTLLFLTHFCDRSFSEDQLAYTFLVTMILVFAVHGIYRIYAVQKGWGMMFVALATYLCDTGAYFFGSFFGKHKMAPRISPNKTWEGAIGGYLAGALGAYLLGRYLCPAFPQYLVLCGALVLPAVGEIGDLAFSSIKRRFEIKDFGSLLPGHGGILDRVDSLLFCLMMFNGLMMIWGL